MAKLASSGYLADTEANRVTVRPGPDVIYLRLVRAFPRGGSEACMFAEMTPGYALRLIRELELAVRIALQHAG